MSRLTSAAPFMLALPERPSWTQAPMPYIEPGHDVDADQNPTGVDTGEAGRLGVVSGCVHVLAPRRVRHDVAEDDVEEETSTTTRR